MKHLFISIPTPLIAHWPAGIGAKNELRSQPSHLIDIMATCAEVSGAPYPRQFKDKPVLPMEGRSLVTAFKNEPIQRDALFWEHEGNAAIRVADMKLVRKGRDGAWELYDMESDRTELHDLASAQPGKANELAARWEAWAERAHVKPYPGNYNLTGGAKKKKGKGKKKAN